MQPCATCVTVWARAVAVNSGALGDSSSILNVAAVLLMGVAGWLQLDQELGNIFGRIPLFFSQQRMYCNHCLCACERKNANYTNGQNNVPIEAKTHNNAATEFLAQRWIRMDGLLTLLFLLLPVIRHFFKHQFAYHHLSSTMITYGSILKLHILPTCVSVLGSYGLSFFRHQGSRS